MSNNGFASSAVCQPMLVGPATIDIFSVELIREVTTDEIILVEY